MKKELEESGWEVGVISLSTNVDLSGLHLSNDLGTLSEREKSVTVCPTFTVSESPFIYQLFSSWWL